MTSYDSDRRVWSGPQIDPLFDPRRSAGDVVLELLDRGPEKPVQIDGDSGKVLTRGELRLRAVRIAQHLRKDYGCGGKNVEIVTIAALGNENLIPLVVALQCLAVPYNALFPNYTEDEMAHMMRQTRSRLMFCDAWNYETVREAARKALGEDVKIFIMDDAVDGVRSVKELLTETGIEKDFKPTTVEDSSKSIWSIFCSSGTTGPPKGICLSHANRTSPFVPENITNIKILATGSIHWISVAYTYDIALFYDSVVVFTRKPFSENLIFDLVEKYKINAINGPPIYASASANHPRAKSADLSSMVLWGIGGYYVSDGVRDAVDAILPNGKSYTIYASTECGLIATDMIKRKLGATGTVSPNIQIRIVDDEGNSLGIGEHGELLVKRLIPFAGYFQQPEATEAVLDSDGWFRSGDVGYFDEEGYLYLVDRKSEIFKYIDAVSPTQLEELISRVDGVEQVCVVGVPVENRSAELPTAVVVKAAGSAVSGEEIAEYVAKNVRDHMKLRGGVHFVDQLPLTSKGNVKRKEVKSVVLKMLNICNQ
ncbi:luciferin 4-monooxygenase-like [Ochlerotatus camptorhynchus]|uniref:luciferin 4-monooxygenase-like n=1 Tax=Ochlerotatus camptorhynchus TaxID=644619 RepID=UPI0031DF147A